MKVIVVKAKLKSKIEFLKTLSDIDLEFGDIYYEHDRIFLPRGYEPAKNLPKMIVRTDINNVNKTPSYNLILKRHIEDQRIDIVHRTGITDYSETARLLHQIGFELFSEVTKQRQDLTMEGGIKIYVDKIDGLGTYVKLCSTIEDGEDAGLVREDLEKTLDALNIDDDSLVDDTYANLMKKK